MMKKSILLLFLTLTFILSFGQDALDQYVNRLRQSAAEGGSETAFMSVGSKFLYGQDYFENKEYDLANMYFNQAYKMDNSNAFVNYQIAASLLKQNDKNKTIIAQKYLKAAFSLNPALKSTYESQFKSGEMQNYADTNPKTNPPQAGVNTPATNLPKTPATPASSAEGKLVYGNYVCTESVWNGPNRSPAYSYAQKGYFALKSNGTYRWLDNGGSGKYTFNEKTGEIKWLSGHLANMKLKKSNFEPGKRVAQINLKFSSDNQWECGCNIK